MRRAGLLSALLITAALLCAMPGLLRSFVRTDMSRMDESLRPAKSRTLTVWLLGGGHDQKPLNELCAAFEKQQRGVRVFLRRVDDAELQAKDAVLPDAVLYLTGQAPNPAQLFLPLTGVVGLAEGAVSSGESASVCYAAPLWVMPNVLSLPSEWFAEEGAPAATPAPKSFFALGTPAPAADGEADSAPTLDSLPWRRLYEENALWTAGGVSLQQLLFVCPNQLRAELVAAHKPDDTVAPQKGAARAWSLREHRAAERRGESLVALPLLPAVSDEARYLSLCRDGEDARAFLRFLLDEEAQKAVQAYDYLPVTACPAAGDELHARLWTLYSAGMMLPNAFAHTREELRALALDGYLRASDPVQTLLKLR